MPYITVEDGQLVKEQKQLLIDEHIKIGGKTMLQKNR